MGLFLYKPRRKLVQKIYVVKWENATKEKWNAFIFYLFYIPEQLLSITITYAVSRKQKLASVPLSINFKR